MPVNRDLNPLAVRVGENIRTLRKARGMKQYTLASEVGYESRSTTHLRGAPAFRPEGDRRLLRRSNSFSPCTGYN